MARGRVILAILAATSSLVAAMGLIRGLQLCNLLLDGGSGGVGLLWAAALTQWLVLPFLLGGAAIGLVKRRRWGRTLLSVSSIPFVALGAMWEFVPSLSLPGYFYPGLAWALMTIGLTHLPAVDLILDGLPKGGGEACGIR